MVVWYGTAGPDTKVGTNAADRLWGRGGNDRLEGRDGDDYLAGENGNDVIYGGDGSDRIYGEVWMADPVGGGDDVLYGEGGDDFINGGSGNDELHGNDGNDAMNGWTGSDRMYGGAGNDWMDAGEEGDETFPLDYPLADELYGGDGNDVLIGRAGKDLLDGGAGDDRLMGGGDADLLRGGPGNDILDGGWWYDNVLEGGPGDDYYRVISTAIEDVDSRVVELPDEGIDTVEYRGDTLGPDGFTLQHIENFLILEGIPVTGEEQNVIFNGNGQNNIITVHDGVSWHLRGWDGDDVLNGSSGLDNPGSWSTGADFLEGGNGNDTLVGLRGADNLVGDAGNDAFRFEAASDSSLAEGGRGVDVIHDFTAGDRIVFGPDFDFDTTRADVQNFTFVGGASDLAAGELGFMREGGNTLILANLDADNYPEFQLLLLGQPALDLDDFATG